MMRIVTGLNNNDTIRFIPAALAMLLLAVTFFVPQPAIAQGGSSFGVWRNPSGSVHVRAEPCGRFICAIVVWANEKARNDARKGGVDPLIGSQLFRNFVEKRAGVWQGKVFVPDIGKTFSGTVTIVDENRIEARGCLLGKIGCKSQTWTRVTME